MTQVESIIKQLQQVLFVERICQEEKNGKEVTVSTFFRFLALLQVRFVFILHFLQNCSILAQVME